MSEMDDRPAVQAGDNSLADLAAASGASTNRPARPSRTALSTP